jgi:hypothetical protein
MLVQLATNRLDGSGNPPDDSQTLSAVIGVFNLWLDRKKRSDTSAKVLAERAHWHDRRSSSASNLQAGTAGKPRRFAQIKKWSLLGQAKEWERRPLLELEDYFRARRIPADK